MRSRKNVVWRIIHTSAEMRILIYFVLFALLILTYTIIFHGLYPQLEGKTVDWAQSVLFVIQTITTTGSLLTYHSDTMVLFASIMMLSGVIMIFMVIPLILTPYLVAVLRSAPARRTPHALFHHTVIIGDGELSRALVESLSLSEKEVLIVEDDEKEARELALKHRRRAFVIWGDYDDPQTWEQAWIKNADFVIVCENERTTASIILGIRPLTPARIISIVDKISFDRYLQYAGAEFVLSPKQVTGRILARHAVLNPGGDTEPAIPGLDRLTINGQEFPEKNLRLIHIPVMPESRAAGKRLGELNLFGQYRYHRPVHLEGGQVYPPPGAIRNDRCHHLVLFIREGRRDSPGRPRGTGDRQRTDRPCGHRGVRRRGIRRVHGDDGIGHLLRSRRFEKVRCERGGGECRGRNNLTRGPDRGGTVLHRRTQR